MCLREVCKAGVSINNSHTERSTRCQSHTEPVKAYNTFVFEDDNGDEIKLDDVLLTVYLKKKETNKMCSCMLH